MAKIENVESGKVLTSDQEIPPFMIYRVEAYDEEADELIVEDRTEIKGEDYRILKDRSDMPR